MGLSFFSCSKQQYKSSKLLVLSDSDRFDYFLYSFSTIRKISTLRSDIEIDLYTQKSYMPLARKSGYFRNIKQLPNLRKGISIFKTLFFIYSERLYQYDHIIIFNHERLTRSALFCLRILFQKSFYDLNFTIKTKRQYSLNSIQENQQHPVDFYLQKLSFLAFDFQSNKIIKKPIFQSFWEPSFKLDSLENHKQLKPELDKRNQEEVKNINLKKKNILTKENKRGFHYILIILSFGNMFNSISEMLEFCIQLCHECHEKGYAILIYGEGDMRSVIQKLQTLNPYVFDLSRWNTYTQILSWFEKADLIIGGRCDYTQLAALIGNAVFVMETDQDPHNVVPKKGINERNHISSKLDVGEIRGIGPVIRLISSSKNKIEVSDIFQYISNLKELKK